MHARQLADIRFKEQMFSALVSLCFIGCISFKDEDAKSKDYKYKAPPEPWEQVDSGSSDIAFQFPADRAIMGVNSVCDQYQKQSLEDLIKNFTSGISEQKILKSEKLMISGFPAVKTIIEGTLDGSAFRLGFAVMRSERCVYDVSLVSKLGLFDEHERTFDAFVKSLQEGEKP